MPIIAIFSFIELVLVVLVLIRLIIYVLILLTICEIYIVKFKFTNILGGMCNRSKLISLYRSVSYLY